MLKIIKIKDPSCKWQWLSHINPKTDCFLVSDVKTKLSIESALLEKEECLPGFCVMRAYEFYTELFYSLNLNWNLVSDLFIQEVFSDFCSQNKETWIRNLRDSNSFFSFFKSFLPLLSHKESPQLFEEWLKEKRKPILWRSWIDLAQKFFFYLEEKKIFPESEKKALLLHHLPLTERLNFKKERIYVDLSFSMDICEAEIFKALSLHREIFILSPQLEKPFLFEKSFDVYQMLEEELGLSQISSLDVGDSQTLSKTLSQEKQTFKVKSETQLEELKKALTQVCKWLSRGVPAKEIALFAPDMEAYWFALKIFLHKEGIPVAKSIFAKVSDYQEIRYFLAALRIHISSFTFEDLEYFSFFRESRKDFSRFKAHYFQVPDRKLSKKFFFENKMLPAHKNLNGKQFTDWALSFWLKENPLFLWEKVSPIFLKLPMTESLKASSWLKILESEIQNLELELKTEAQEGISCLSLNALSSSKKPYVYILDLSERALKSSGSSVFNEREKKEILEELGFPLSFSHPQEKPHNLLWFLQSSHHKEVYLSFSAYNLKGTVQTPSLLYFLSEDLFSAKKREVREELSWEADRKQRAFCPPDRDSESFKMLSSSFQNKERAFFHPEKIQLSPNRLKTYIECPFKYAAEKLFFVQANEKIDRELSPLSKGSITHQLFENVLAQYPKLLLSEKQMEKLLEQVKPKEEDFIYGQQWPLLKEELKELLKAFLNKERADQKNFPFLKAKAFEKELSAYWNQKKGELDRRGEYLFRARVDRIDQDKTTGAYVVRDYKASSQFLTHISSWIQNGKEDFQLIFYAQALQKGLISDLPAAPVSSVFYAFYKEDFSAKGFVEKGSSMERLLGENLRGPKKEKQVLEQAILLSNKQAKTVIQKMEKGEFSPKPKEKSLCKRCFYSSWCRIETLEG